MGEVLTKNEKIEMKVIFDRTASSIDLAKHSSEFI